MDQNLVQRTVFGKGVTDQRGDVHDRGFEVIVCLGIRFEMIPDNLHMAVGQLPVFHQQRGDPGVIESDHIPLSQV